MSGRRKKHALTGILMGLVGLLCALLLGALFYGMMVYQLAGIDGGTEDGALAAEGTPAPLEEGAPVQALFPGVLLALDPSMAQQTGITAQDELYPAMVLFNACFGGSTASRLFLGVRETLSLCYYASSQTDKTKGVMSVSSGIENANYERARDEILRELKDMQDGGITEQEQELETARRSVLSSLRSMQDSPLSMEQFYQTQAVSGAQGGLDELTARIECTTREQVIRAAQSASVDTIYFLKGGAAHD